MTQALVASVVPLVMGAVALQAMLQGVDVFPCFLKGAEKGLRLAVSLCPILVGLLTAVQMLRASGAIDLLSALLAPCLELVGIPKECAALILLKPISGSGGLALGSEIIRRYGVDSYIGNVTAVMLSASETSVYTIGLYSGHLKMQNTRYALPAALLADLVAFISAAFFVRLLL